tara:strand:- start:962 stop:1183 length:222 start_codon:yes stop_codon:yes gene_type:complete
VQYCKKIPIISNIFLIGLKYMFYNARTSRFAGHLLIDVITLALICLLRDHLQVENYIDENLLILPIQVYHGPS